MDAARQSWALLRMSLQDVTKHLEPAITIVIGVSCAVGVLVSMLAMGAGFRRQALADVRPDRVVLTTIGAASLGQSSIARDVAASIGDLPDVKRTANDRPIALSELLILIEARRRVTGAQVFFPMLGVTAGLRQVYPELHLVAGRMFHSGVHELIASAGCARQFVGFEVGDRRIMRGGDWHIVGQFVQGHARDQCTVYGDADALLSAFGRNSFNEVVVRLQSPSDYRDFVGNVKANPTLRVEARHEKDVVEQGLKPFNRILNFASYFVGAIMAIGATLGAVNSLYLIVDERRRELATLRAIGFGSGAILAATLCESILLALPGAVLGGIASWLFFNGLSVSPLGLSFQLDVTPNLIGLGAAWAFGMGLIGGLMPAFQAARVSVTTALRAI
jgi:putative ABC transport system permease protein